MSTLQEKKLSAIICISAETLANWSGVTNKTDFASRVILLGYVTLENVNILGRPFGTVILCD